MKKTNLISENIICRVMSQTDSGVKMAKMIEHLETTESELMQFIYSDARNSTDKLRSGYEAVTATCSRIIQDIENDLITSAIRGFLIARLAERANDDDEINFNTSMGLDNPEVDAENYK